MGYGSDFMPWVDKYVEFEGMTEEELKKIEEEHKKTLEEIYLLLALLWLRMGDSINLGKALIVGLDSTRSNIHANIDRLYDNAISSSIKVYLPSIYMRGYVDALNRLPSSFKSNKMLPYQTDEFVAGQLNLRWAGDGKLYSDRIWEHKAQLKTAMDRIIHESITAGRDIKMTSKDFAQAMGSSYSNAERLVRTETNYVLNQSELQVLKDTGVEKYEYIAYLDRRTSAVCREHDGKVYLTSQAQVGVNYPPLHPRCRSTVAPFIDLDD